VRIALEPGLTDAPDIAGLDLRTGFPRVQETLCAIDWPQVYARSVTLMEQVMGFFSAEELNLLEGLLARMMDRMEPRT
jgi:hypothetical protein